MLILRERKRQAETDVTVGEESLQGFKEKNQTYCQNGSVSAGQEEGSEGYPHPLSLPLLRTVSATFPSFLCDVYFLGWGEVIWVHLDVLQSVVGFGAW